MSTRMNRRGFIQKTLTSLGALWLPRRLRAHVRRPQVSTDKAAATVYRAVNGRPAENVAKVLDLMGGVARLFGPDDVVVIKPNIQWTDQGVPNLQAVQGLVALIFARPGGFAGEVILIENVHRGPEPWHHAGWAHPFVRNADITGIHNYNSLCDQLKSRYGDRFSVCHLINAKDGGRRIYHPSEAPGYIYCDGTGGLPLIAFNNSAPPENYREVIMTYPVFRSDRGTVVDFRYGVWQSGRYTKRPWKFVNVAGINHHSTWCGISSAIKNYLGISDLSGGPDPHDDGKLTEAYYNFHAFPFDKWAPGPRPGMIGAEIGVFLDKIRRADLNIVTAEWVGLGSRVALPVARTRAVLASTDPVALDYHSAKYVLHSNSNVGFHDPDDPDRPTHQYIKACADHGGGIFDERRVALVSYDLKAGRHQREDEAAIIGKMEWGTNPKDIGKYLMMRYGSWFL